MEGGAKIAARPRLSPMCGDKPRGSRAARRARKRRTASASCRGQRRWRRSCRGSARRTARWPSARRPRVARSAAWSCSQLDLAPALLVGVVLRADGDERFLLLGGEQRRPAAPARSSIDLELALERRRAPAWSPSRPCACPELLLAACQCRRCTPATDFSCAVDRATARALRARSISASLRVRLQSARGRVRATSSRALATCALRARPRLPSPDAAPASAPVRSS